MNEGFGVQSTEVVCAPERGEGGSVHTWSTCLAQCNPSQDATWCQPTEGSVGHSLGFEDFNSKMDPVKKLVAGAGCELV